MLGVGSEGGRLVKKSGSHSRRQDVMKIKGCIRRQSEIGKKFGLQRCMMENYPYKG